jgi:putative phage-type endonuclease
MLTIEQKEIRRSGLGGSDIAAICGLNQYKTPLDVYMDKIGEGKEIELNEAIDMGNRLEPVVADIYAEKTGKTLKEVPTIFHPSMPYMLANVDRMIVEDNAVLEIKTTNSRNEHLWGSEGSDEIPMAYLLQCAHYALITDAPYVDIAVLIGGYNFKMYKYNRNAELEYKIIQKAAQFWNDNVVKRIPPNPINAKDTAKWWSTRTTSKNAKVATTDIIACIEQFKTIKSEKSLFEKKEEEYKEMIQMFMNDSEILIDEEGNVLAQFKAYERNSVDTKKLKETNPELYNTILKTSCYRQLRI